VPVNLAVPASHPLAGITSIATEELADEVIVLFPRPLNPAVWDLFVEHLSPVGPVRLGHVLVVNDLVTDGPRGLVRVVAAGQGLAPTVSAVADDAVVTRPLDPALAVPLDLIQREPARPVLRRAHRAVRGWSLTGYFPGLGGRDTKTT
jgi:hypothetical protein